MSTFLYYENLIILSKSNENLNIFKKINLKNQFYVLI